MDLRSVRYIASGEARRRVELGHAPSVVPDHISALPDDLLFLILVRLRCVATAARTGILAHRWRLLWTQLPALVFPDVSFRCVTTALDALLDSPAATCEVSLLEIRVARATHRFTELLRDAALFQPEEFLLAVPWGGCNLYQSVDLPRFNRTTSISLSIGDGKYPTDLRLPPTAAGGCLFPALTTLVLSGYYAKDGLATLLSHCPRLGVLRYTVRGHWNSRQDYAITVHSATLRELVVEESAMANRVDVATPMLNQLTVSCYCLIRGDLTTVSIVEPLAEKVWWRCRQSNGLSSGFGCWYLQTRKGSGSWITYRFEKEVENHLQLQVAADLSAMDLELHLVSAGHVYGALAVYLLGMRRVRTAVRRLKLALITIPEGYRGKWRCNGLCRCEPTQWRSQSISLMELEEVEIDGFQGENHEFDFLEVISRCAPMLRRVTVKPVEGAANDARIRGIFKAHPSVECCVLPSK
ncbi:hypothetical protein ACQ4PT_050865 [Festuca glaucescens]